MFAGLVTRGAHRGPVIAAAGIRGTLREALYRVQVLQSPVECSHPQWIPQEPLPPMIRQPPRAFVTQWLSEICALFNFCWPAPAKKSLGATNLCVVPPQVERARELVTIFFFFQSRSGIWSTYVYTNYCIQPCPTASAKRASEGTYVMTLVNSTCKPSGGHSS